MAVMHMQVQALIQGRASLWQQNLVLTPTKGGAGDPVRCAAPPYSTDRQSSLRSA